MVISELICQRISVWYCHFPLDLKDLYLQGKSRDHVVSALNTLRMKGNIC